MNTNIIERRLRRDNNLPESFCFSRYACFPPTGETIYLELGGGECDLVRRGKRKGRPNWDTLRNSRTFVVRVEDAEQWELDYEAETGNCRRCMGTGEVFSGWSAADGTKRKPCPLCGGKKRAVALTNGNGGQ